MKINDCKEEIISYVMNSSDVDNFIIATFIAGMQAKRNVRSSKNNNNQTSKSLENRTT